MDKVNPDIIAEYDRKKDLFEEFGKSLENLLLLLLKDKGLSPHFLNFRVKDRKSLESKIVRKNNKYKSLNEMTDLLGLRIITYFEDDIDKISSVIGAQFKIDQNNSIDKRAVDIDRFGYRSLHYVIELTSDRTSLTEYKQFKDLKAEIQIRSILQHSWAEIEHDLGYKSEHEIPAVARRTFCRVAALLEQADIEFVKLRSQIYNYESSVKEQIFSNPSSVLIDKASLVSFIKENTTLKGLELKISSEILPMGKEQYDHISDNVFGRLEVVGIKTIKDLEVQYSARQNEIFAYQQKAYGKMGMPSPNSLVSFVPGATILWLIDVLLAEIELNRRFTNANG